MLIFRQKIFPILYPLLENLTTRITITYIVVRQYETKMFTVFRIVWFIFSRYEAHKLTKQKKMAFSLARTLPLLAVSRGSRRKGKSGNSGNQQVLSPAARGLLLVPVFILWIGLSGWFETSKLSVGPEFQSRSKYSNRNKAENDQIQI